MESKENEYNPYEERRKGGWAGCREEVSLGWRDRLLASDENGFVANYWYDADGERTVKSSGEGE